MYRVRMTWLWKKLVEEKNQAFGALRNRVMILSISTTPFLPQTTKINPLCLIYIAFWTDWCFPHMGWCWTGAPEVVQIWLTLVNLLFLWFLFKENVPYICRDFPQVCAGVSRQGLGLSNCFSEGPPSPTQLQDDQIPTINNKAKQRQVGSSRPKKMDAWSTVYSSFQPRDIHLHSAI